MPDARAACEPLRHAMGESWAAAQSVLGETEAAEKLNAYVTPRLDELEAALTQASGKPLSVQMRPIARRGA